MRRALLILATLTACSSPSAAPPTTLSLAERTVESPRSTVIERPAATMTVTGEPPATSKPTVPPTPPVVGTVINGGNLRTEPRIASDTVIGQLIAGDEVVFLEGRTLGESTEGVPVETEGWFSSTLLSPPSAPVVIHVDPTDHITPQHHGGDHHDINIQLLYRHCHDTKTASDGSLAGRGAHTYEPSD